jgi:hypothetical protein
MLVVEGELMSGPTKPARSLRKATGSAVTRAVLAELRELVAAHPVWDRLNPTLA